MERKETVVPEFSFTAAEMVVIHDALEVFLETEREDLADWKGDERRRTLTRDATAIFVRLHEALTPPDAHTSARPDPVVSTAGTKEEDRS